jgi:hypothetical protein
MAFDRKLEVGIARKRDEPKTVTPALLHLNDRQGYERPTQVAALAVDECGEGLTA